MGKVYFMQQTELLKLFLIKLESHQGKDKTFYEFSLELGDRNILYKIGKVKKTRIPFYAVFVKQGKYIDGSSTLYSIKMPFELVYADIADIRFCSRSAFHPKYCLLPVDLFTSKVFRLYNKKQKSRVKKLEHFYRDVQPEREETEENVKTRLLTDLEFAQNEIKNLNKKYNVEMFSSRV